MKNEPLGDSVDFDLLNDLPIPWDGAIQKALQPILKEYGAQSRVFIESSGPYGAPRIIDKETGKLTDCEGNEISDYLRRIEISNLKGSIRSFGGNPNIGVTVFEVLKKTLSHLSRFKDLNVSEDIFEKGFNGNDIFQKIMYEYNLTNPRTPFIPRTVDQLEVHIMFANLHTYLINFRCVMEESDTHVVADLDYTCLVEIPIRPDEQFFVYVTPYSPTISRHTESIKQKIERYKHSNKFGTGEGRSRSTRSRGDFRE